MAGSGIERFQPGRNLGFRADKANGVKVCHAISQYIKAAEIQ